MRPIYEKIAEIKLTRLINLKSFNIGQFIPVSEMKVAVSFVKKKNKIEIERELIKISKKKDLKVISCP